MDSNDLRQAQVPSPIGMLTVVIGDRGIRRIRFADERSSVDADRALPQATEAESAPIVAQLDAYFAGERVEFDLPLDLAGTEFQVQAWRALATIPFGETVTYGEQAKRIGRPGAFRAVGAANGANPIPIVLPCHRVVGADGSLTGFAGGLDTKRWLLDHEQGQRALL